MSLSSAEAEMSSSGTFAVPKHVPHIDNSAAQQIAMKRGCGKIRHLDAKAFPEVVEFCLVATNQCGRLGGKAIEWQPH